MTTGKDLFDPGSALVPVTDLAPVARSAEVVGTVRVLDGELVVRIRPAQYRDVTGRPVGTNRDVEVAEHPLARLGLRSVGPLTPEEAARFRADVAWWDARPCWRRWATDFADCCWRWRR
jgi:hypothetical protein